MAEAAARDLAVHAHGSTHAHTTGTKQKKRERRKKTPVSLPESVVDLYRMSAAILAIHEDKRASGALIAIAWLAHTPFGYALRAGRDSRLRAEASGIDVRATQWAAFALAGFGFSRR